jgi:integrase
MAIYQRGKSYYYDFVYKCQRYTGCIGPVSRTVAKEEEARKKAEVIEGRLNPAKTRRSPPFDDFAQEYLEWLRVNRKPLTVKKAHSVLERLTAFFGSKRLNEISAWDMERYKKERKEAGRQPNTVNVELVILKAMLNRAMAWKKLSEHPGKEVKALKGVQGRTRFLSEEEEAAILAVCSPALRYAVEVGLLTGFRRQELVNLRPEDVDLERGTVTVAACYSKNGESRTNPIGERLKAILREALPVRGDAPTVLVTRYGKPWTTEGVTNQFQRASRRAGLERLGPHVLRHTYASWLVMAGVDLRTVQELLGHKDIKQTMRYAHLSPSHKQAAVEALERKFPAKSPVNSHNTPLTAMPPTSAKVVSIQRVSA